MTDKPTSAQAVYDQFLANVPISLGHGLAAAIHTVADRVVPPDPFDWRYITEEKWDARDDVRAELLTIAAELEALPNG